MAKFKPDLWKFKEFLIKKDLQDYMQGQEQQTFFKNQTVVMSCFDCFWEHNIWKEPMGT